jgi:predicted phage terminase large subunit-like protein
MPDGTPTFTPEELDLLLENIDHLDDAEAAELYELVEDLANRQRIQRLRDDLIAFCQHMQDDYKVGAHHKRLAGLLEDIEMRRKDRICVSVAPRHGKSQLVSIYFAAWYIGRNPGHKIMLVSHTTDLAVDFGRKIRNIVATDRYKEVFPDVSLASDSKSAGRWNTNHGGEFFACLAPDTPVRTVRGSIPAREVRLDDCIIGSTGPAPVLAVFDTSHSETVTIAGGEYSTEHPIWTFNRGWVNAGDLRAEDLLWAESFWDRLKALVWRAANGFVEHPDVPSLVQHQVALREPKQRKVSPVRRAWNQAVRSLARVPSIFVGRGTPTVPAAYAGQDRREWSLQPRELQMGDASGASEQQARERGNSGPHAGSAWTTIEFDARGTAVSCSARAFDGRGSESGQEAPKALQNPSGSETLGWIRRFGVWLLAGRRGCTEPKERRGRAQVHLASVYRWSEKLCGLLMGVRLAGEIRREVHTPRPFVNFRVGGDNTLFSGGVLSHNCGVGSAIAGRGAHMLIVDDPHSEQDVLAGNFSVFQKAYEWFTFGARTRLMPGGAVAVVATRWHQADLIGRLVADMAKNQGSDTYEVFEFPAILDAAQTDPDTGETRTVQKALWPEFFDLPALLRTKASMPAFQWNAQYQQQPTAEEAAIVKREWWRRWEKDQPPACDYVIMSLDAAAETHNRADYTAITTWGVFKNEEEGAHQIILLHALKERFEFPELKREALQHYKDWEPDSFIVEKKSAGVALYQELRRMGIPVQEFTPHRGSGDKTARLNSVSDIISSGMVWVPDRRWAEELVEEVAAFPFGANDDLADCTTMALMRFRQGGFVALPTDDWEDDTQTMPRRADYY